MVWIRKYVLVFLGLFPLYSNADFESFKAAILQNQQANANTSGQTDAQLKIIYLATEEALTSMRPQLERFKALTYAIANQDLGNSDQMVIFRQGGAIILGYSLRGGVGVRRNVEKVYPVLAFQFQIDVGIGGAFSGSLISDRRATGRGPLSVNRDDDSVGAFIVGVETIEQIDGEGSVYENAIVSNRQKIKDAEKAGQLTPKWKFWSSKKRKEELAALHLNPLESWGVAREGGGFGLGFGMFGDLIGVQSSVPIPFIAGKNAKVRDAFDRTLSTLSHLAEHGRSGRMLKADGPEMMKLLARDFSEAVSQLDTAVRASSSYTGYSRIPTSLKISDANVFQSPETLINSGEANYLRAPSGVPLKEAVCDLTRGI